MKLLIPLLLMAAASAEHLRAGWLEMQEIVISDDGNGCGSKATAAPNVVGDMRQQMKTVEYQLEWIQAKEKKVPAIVSKIIALAVITTSLPIASWLFKTFVTAVQGIKSDLSRIDDYAALEKALASLVYAFYFGMYGYPAVFRLAQGESEAYGISIHSLSLFAMVWNLVEALNLWSVINGTSDNRWQGSGIWEDWITYILTFAGGCTLFGAIVAVADKTKLAVQWSSLGAYSGLSMASVMTVVIVTLGLLAAFINFHAAFSYRNPETRAFVAAKIVDKDHKEQVDQLLRTRWFAPWISVFTAAGFCLNIAALDAQDDETATVSMFVTIIGGCVSGLNVIYSVKILQSIVKTVKKYGSKLVALFTRRPAN